MTETELETFSPRHTVVLTLTGSSVSWPAFARGKNGVERITMNESGMVRVQFADGVAIRLVGMTDAIGVEKRAEVVPLKPPPKDPPLAAMVGASSAPGANLATQRRSEQGKKR